MNDKSIKMNKPKYIDYEQVLIDMIREYKKESIPNKPTWLVNKKCFDRIKIKTWKR